MIEGLQNGDELAASWGKRCRALRIVAQLRQEDLAELSGASLQAVKNLERDGRVELSTLAKVLKALGREAEITQALETRETSLEEALLASHAIEEPAARARKPGGFK